MSKLEIVGFGNRGSDEHPFGFIDFTDGLRIGYAPGARGVDEDGLFNTQQPYNERNKELTLAHVDLARTWVRSNPATK